ncbi:MAG: sugar kinase [Cohaesibacteraceae bacterium]
MIELSDLAASDGRVAMGVAGDTLNGAIYLSRCLSGTSHSVDYLTALGTDQLSDRMIAFMEGEGVGAGHIVRRTDRLPGIYAIELDEAGERSFRYWRSQSAARTMLDEGGLTDDALQAFDVLVLSAITLAILSEGARQSLIEACAAMKAAGKLVVFDSNYRPALWQSENEARDTISAMWAATVLALPSRDDEAKLWPGEDVPALMDRLAGLGISEIALKDGATGPWLWAGEALPRADFPSAAHVVDTTSAGDSFNAGYLAARLVGDAPVDAAMAGHRLASAVIGEKGAIIPRAAMPDVR